MRLHPLGEQIRGRLIAGLLRDREHLTRGAHHRLVSATSCSSISLAVGTPSSSVIEDSFAYAAYEPGAGNPSVRGPIRDHFPASASSVYWVSNIRCSELNI
jgi:hypothetical protein